MKKVNKITILVPYEVYIPEELNQKKELQAILEGINRGCAELWSSTGVQWKRKKLSVKQLKELNNL